MDRVKVPQTILEWNERGNDSLSGHLGIEMLTVEPDEVRARMPIDTRTLSWHGYLHGGAVVSLADCSCGAGTLRNLPDDALGFTTVELKCNLISTALEGDAVCIAKPVHRGRTTQVWDAEVLSTKSGKTIAVFRCTQMILRS